MAGAPLQWLDAEEVRDRVPPEVARAAVEALLREGFDPARDPARVHVPAGAGHLLLMPSSTASAVGVKVASVAPGNPARGQERIQGLYVLMDAGTLTPRAVLDGPALTAVRTPAVSAAAADRLAPADAGRLLVFGAGPQAWGHVEALRAIRPLTAVTVVGRRRSSAEALRDRIRDHGLSASVGAPGDVAGAPLVVCATSAGEPLFDGSLVADGACVVAIGSHEPDKRELDGPLMGRARVVVEDVATALREAGDVVLAAREGMLDTGGLVTLADLVTGRAARADDRPNVFKGVGMSWQDLAVASVASPPG